MDDNVGAAGGASRSDQLTATHLLANKARWRWPGPFSRPGRVQGRVLECQSSSPIMTCIASRRVACFPARARAILPRPGGRPSCPGVTVCRPFTRTPGRRMVRCLASASPDGVSASPGGRPHGSRLVTVHGQTPIRSQVAPGATPGPSYRHTEQAYPWISFTPRCSKVALLTDGLQCLEARTWVCPLPGGPPRRQPWPATPGRRGEGGSEGGRGGGLECG